MADGDLTLTTKAFAEGDLIPRVHAHEPEGDHVSPQLSWSDVPAGTKELGVGEGAAKADLLHAMEGHALAEAGLVGSYSR